MLGELRELRPTLVRIKVVIIFPNVNEITAILKDDVKPRLLEVATMKRRLLLNIKT